MIGLIGKKIGMTQLFDEEGRQIPVTILQLGPCRVTGVKNKEKHGYKAVEISYGAIREKLITKARLGHLKKTGTSALRFTREIRTEETDGIQEGQMVGVSNFESGDYVDVLGTSIGRGFQGVVKRHHFKGGASKSHGSMFGRVPGSIGASSFPSRVVKGMRAAGHMGNAKTTVQNLKVMKVDGENNLILVQGSVPGAENGLVMVRTSLKRGVRRKWKVEGGNASQDAPLETSKPESSEAKP